MINLMYAGNDKVFDGLLISLLSITKHNKDELSVFILTTDLSAFDENYKPFSTAQAKILEDVLKETNQNSKVQIIRVDEFNQELTDSANANSSYTPFAYLRLYADEFNEIPNKILYLDYDTVANANISELYNINIENHEFAASFDYYGRWFIGPRYCNSGVMLLNMQKIRESKLFKKCREVCHTKKMLLPDQSALNKCVKKKLILPQKFNSQKKLKQNTVIRHFSKTIKFFPWFHTVNVKPWHIERLHEFYKCFEFDDILSKYTQIKEKYYEQ